MIYALLTLIFAPLLRWRAARDAVLPPRSILVIQIAKIGDLVSSTPVFRELKQGHPGCQLHVMATPTSAPVIRNNPHVDRIIEACAEEFQGLSGKVRLFQQLRAGKYDTLICLNSGITYPVCALWALVPARLGVVPNFCGRSCRLASRLWTAVEPHRADRLIQQTYLSLLGHLGVNSERVDREVFTAEDARAKAAAVLGNGSARWVGIGIATANKLKELGADKIVAVIRGLLADAPDTRIVLVGGPGDREDAESILRAVEAEDRISNTVAVFALEELPALLERLSVYVGVDSAVTHMADAVGTPVVSVAGPCNMNETRPLNPRAAVIQHQLPCVPCSHTFRAPYTCQVGTRACVQGVAAAEIVRTAVGILNAAEGENRRRVRRGTATSGYKAR